MPTPYPYTEHTVLILRIPEAADMDAVSAVITADCGPHTLSVSPSEDSDPSDPDAIWHKTGTSDPEAVWHKTTMLTFETLATAELAVAILHEHPALTNLAIAVYPTIHGKPDREPHHVWPVYFNGDRHAANAVVAAARPEWTDWCDWPEDIPLPGELYAAVRGWGALYTVAVAVNMWTNALSPRWRGVARFVSRDDAVQFAKDCRQHPRSLGGGWHITAVTTLTWDDNSSTSGSSSNSSPPRPITPNSPTQQGHPSPLAKQRASCGDVLSGHKPASIDDCDSVTSPPPPRSPPKPVFTTWKLGMVVSPDTPRW